MLVERCIGFVYDHHGMVAFLVVVFLSLLFAHPATLFLDQLFGTLSGVVAVAVGFLLFTVVDQLLLQLLDLMEGN